MSIDIAYVAGGRLHLKFGDASPKQVESKFAREVRERLLRVEERNAWKTQGSGAQFMGGRLLWGMQPKQEEATAVQVRGISRGVAPAHVLYSLGGDQIGGVFSFDPETAEERRLIHGTSHVYDDLALHRELGLVACSVPKRDFSRCIAVMKSDLSDYGEVTEGDSIDMSPSWVPGDGRQLVFESAGIARNGAGAFVGMAPAVIHRLDVDSGDLQVAAEDPAMDLTRPRVAADGALYYIRRPHTATPKPSFWRANLDFLLFPARLLFAFMQYLNFFSARYSGKALTTAGNAKQKGADMKQMMIWENLMAADHDADPNEPKALVPSSFQLVRQRGLKTETVARSVAAYDIAADGAIVYSTGNAIYHLDAAGKRTRVCEDQPITNVIWL